MMRLRLLVALLAALVVSGCQTKDPVAQALDQPLVARFYLEAKPGEQGTQVQMPVSKVQLVVNPKPVLVEYDIANLEFAKVSLGWCLYFQFTPAAARDLYRLTAANPRRRLVLMLNDTPVGIRPIDQVISDGVLLTFVELPDEELPPVVERIRRTSAKLRKDRN